VNAWSEELSFGQTLTDEDKDSSGTLLWSCPLHPVNFHIFWNILLDSVLAPTE